MFDYITSKQGGPEALQAVFGAHENMIRLLNLTKSWLVSYLPHCMSKRCRVDYGPLILDDLIRWEKVERESTGGGTPDENDEITVFERFKQPPSRRSLVVPFMAKDVPSRSSEFASPEILIGLTILAYRYVWVR